MQTLLQATGETKLLNPLTDRVPGPMLPLLNRPLMSYQLELLARQGFDQALVSVYHMADQIERYFNTGDRWRVHLTYLLQPEPLGNAGALKWAEHAIHETILCLPADSVIEIDLAAALAAHKASGCVATAIVTRGQKTALKRYRVDHSGHILGLGYSHPTVANWNDTGMYLFEPEVLQYIPRRKKFDVYSQLIPALLVAEQEVGTWELTDRCGLLDSFQGYARLQHDFLYECYYNAQAAPLVAPDWKGMETERGIWVGRNHRIHPSVQLTPPVLIGENTYVGPNAQIGPDVVIGANAMIEEGVTVAHSTIFDQSYVGMLLKIDHYLINHDLLIDFPSETKVSVSDGIFLHNTLLKRPTRKVSRLLDLLLAVLVLVLTLPLALLAVLWLLLIGSPLLQKIPHLARQSTRQDPGNSYHLRTFPLYRFATTKPASKWLERLEIHRIPELWSVIKGDMRIVGVSPQPANNAYRMADQWWTSRQNEMPGLTGLWYVETVINQRQEDWMIADSVYFVTHSFWTDVMIVLRTPFAWLRHVLNQPQLFFSWSSVAMKMEIKNLDGVRVLKISGPFRGKDTDQVRTWLDNTIHQDCPNVIVNLEEVSTVDSRALSTLLFGMKESRKHMGNFVLCGLQQPVRILFEMTRMSQLFTILPKEQDAMLEFGKRAPLNS